MGGEFTLPDGRAYELVSPAQKDGAEILGIGGGGTTPAGGDATQASEDGTNITYIASAPVGANPPGNTLATQIFSTRGADGWSSQDIATPHKNAIGPDHILNEGEEYVRFSSDLSRAVLRPLHNTPEPPLAPEVHQQVSGETEIYLRNDATGVFQALVTTEPLPELTPSNDMPVAFEGATPDLGHVVFEGPAGLDPHYPGAGGTYEWSDGHTGLVDVLPTTGQPSSGASLLASDSRNSFGDVLASTTRYAVSSDGRGSCGAGKGTCSRVTWRRGKRFRWMLPRVVWDRAVVVSSRRPAAMARACFSPTRQNSRAGRPKGACSCSTSRLGS